MIHTFRRLGSNIAVDTESGAVHVLSPIAYKMLSYIKPPLTQDMPVSLRYSLARFDSSDVEEAYEELYSLYEQGELFSDPIPLGDISKALSTRIKSMCLHVSHDCNMRCRYCFADCGGYVQERKLMSLETGKRALDFLIEKSGGVRNLEVDFFGGEPLLNFDVVREITRYGRELEAKHGKKIRFTMTTNGSLLDDESIDFINAEMSNVVLSIDGRPEVNDYMRPFEDGSGSYETVIPKFKKLVERRGDGEYYVRGTFTRRNLDFTADVLHLVDSGFNAVSVEPVVLPEESEYSIRKEDLPAIFAEYEKLALEYIARAKAGRPFTFFHFMIDLDGGPCAIKRAKGCGSGCEYVAVTPDGSIYPCHQFAGEEKFKMGNIFDGVIDENIRNTFAHCNLIENPTCADCWAKYYCGSGCAANNFHMEGNVMKPYSIACELERARVEFALAIKAALAK